MQPRQIESSVRCDTLRGCRPANSPAHIAASLRYKSRAEHNLLVTVISGVAVVRKRHFEPYSCPLPYTGAHSQLWRMRVWAVSDVHTDHAENLAWYLRKPRNTALPRSNFPETNVCRRCERMSGETGSDCMILAGDVSDNLDIFRATLICFTSKYKVNYEQSTLPHSLSSCCQAVLL